MSSLSFKFKMPIGDRSNDGHGQCDIYYIKSNKPVERVRDAHFMIKEKLGIDLDNVCREYGDDELSGALAYTLTKMGFFDTLSDEDIDEAYEYDKEDEIYHMRSYGLACMWMFLLCKADETLKLEMVHDDTPTLTNGGRYIEFSGYGVFE